MFGRRAQGPDIAYSRSLAATSLPFQPGVVARGLALRVLNAGEDPDERQRLGQLLVNELSAVAHMQTCELVIADRPQVHAHDGQRLQSKTYGYYRCWFTNGSVSRARIRIYHRTAVRRQVTTPKVFLNTLLHEWVHHHDFAGMGLPRSPHTSGFYARLRSLADSLQVSQIVPATPDRAAVRMADTGTA